MAAILCSSAADAALGNPVMQSGGAILGGGFDRVWGGDARGEHHSRHPVQRILDVGGFGEVTDEDVGTRSRSALARTLSRRTKARTVASSPRRAAMTRGG